MSEENLLSGGVDKLNEIKEDLLELRGYQESYDKLTIEGEKNEKSIQSLEKAASDEVQATIKKRRAEIESAYDKQLDKIRSKIKKIKDKRDKRKNKKVSERIDEETAALREENRELKLETRTLLKQKHVPSFCNTKLYYALYYPRYFSDILIILLVLLLTLLVIPCGIYFFILPEEKILYLVLIYIASVIIFGGLYLLTGNSTKDKHGEILKQLRELRHKIHNNKKQIKVIKKYIRKDRDESRYGLENFDEELKKLDDELADLGQQKKDALLTFENTTIQVITSEIRKQYEEKIASLKADNEEVGSKTSQAEERIKALTLKIASEYEPFIGKDLITLDRIESLINIIEAGNASNISEAIQFHRQNMG
jgi:chromosome segregation ATPase